MNAASRGFSRKRWLGIAAVLIWLSCIPMVPLSPWLWANEAEHLLNLAHDYKDEVRSNAKQSVASRQDELTRVRRAAWIEWLWLVGAIGGGLLTAIIGRKNKVVWATGMATFAVAYIMCRLYFVPSSYSQLFLSLVDDVARAGQIKLATTTPVPYALLSYYNIVVPLALGVIVAVRLNMRDEE